MGKARNLARLLVDGNGDVDSSALANVPPSNDASALTTGTLSADRLGSASITAAKLASGAAASNLGSYVTSVNGQAGAVSVTAGPPTVSAGTVYYGQPQGYAPYYTTNFARRMYVTMGVSGTVRARASASSWTNGEGANQYATCRFYKNGVAQGSSISPGLNQSATLTTDITVSPGDNIELYGQLSGSQGSGSITGIEIGVSSGTFVPSTTVAF